MVASVMTLRLYETPYRFDTSAVLKIRPQSIENLTNDKNSLAGAEMSAQWKRNRFLRYGAPFLVLVVGGSFIIKQFSMVRYKYSQKSLSPKEVYELEKAKTRQHVTIEEAYESIKTMDIDNWEQIRGPRPWEQQPDQPDKPA